MVCHIQKDDRRLCWIAQLLFGHQFPRKLKRQIAFQCGPRLLLVAVDPDFLFASVVGYNVAAAELRWRSIFVNRRLVGIAKSAAATADAILQVAEPAANGLRIGVRMIGIILWDGTELRMSRGVWRIYQRKHEEKAHHRYGPQRSSSACLRTRHAP